MYLPDHFVEARDAEIARIMDDFPLAAIVAQTATGLVANHIPLLRDGNERLIGHIARNNDLHRDLSDGADVLAIFRADNAYISPNWYPSKQEHHRHVPTWNYQAVHVSGVIRFSHEEKTKRAIVGRLTQHFEGLTGSERPWRMADAPRDYLDEMLVNIVGFEIAVTRVIAKSKLSQNRDKADFDTVVGELDASGQGGLVAAMRRLDRS